MKVNIKTDGVELSPDLEQYLQKKMAHLERFGSLLGNDALMHLILAKTSNHHRTGEDAYSAEIQLNAMGHNIMAKSLGADIRSAIDGLKDELSKVLTSSAGKDRSLMRRGGAFVKRFLKGDQSAS